MARRPPDTCGDENHFYLATMPESVVSDSGKFWFKKQPIGIQKLGNLLKTAAKKAKIEKNLTNHSARKFMIQKLSDEGIETRKIMQKSGHKCVESVNAYNVLNDNDQRKMSTAVCNLKSSNEVTFEPSKKILRPEKDNDMNIATIQQQIEKKNTGSQYFNGAIGCTFHCTFNFNG